MGQKTNPISNRLGIIRGWDSSWYGGKNYGDRIAEDAKIRQYLNKRLESASLSRIVIERTLKLITITIHTARPGFIIGRAGQEVDKLKKELENLTKKEIQINIFEIKRPEIDALVVARNIARQVEGRISYRRAIKTAIAATMRSAQGIKVQISGRLAGAEIARAEIIKEGRIPLHTLRSDVDYALAEALTKVGILGVKVWICNGELYGKRDLSPATGSNTGGSNYAMGNERYGGGFNGDRRGGYGRRDERRDRPHDDRDRKDRDRLKSPAKRRSSGHDKKKPRDTKK